jgi:hypothetical protein
MDLADEADDFGLSRALSEPLVQLRDSYLAAAAQIARTLEGLNALIARLGAAEIDEAPGSQPEPRRERTVRMEVRGGDIAGIMDFQEHLAGIDEVSRVSVIGLEGDRATLIVELARPEPPTVICMGCGKTLVEGGQAISHGLCESCATAFKSQRRVRPDRKAGDQSAATG